MARISTPAEIRRSILDLRGIYHELSDERFAIWYSRRYKVPVKDVAKVIESSK